MSITLAPKNGQEPGEIGQIGLSFEPKLIRNKPKLIRNGPKLIKNRPKLIKKRPKLIKKRPKLIKKKPKLIKNRPKLIKNKPKLNGKFRIRSVAVQRFGEKREQAAVAGSL